MDRSTRITEERKKEKIAQFLSEKGVQWFYRAKPLPADVVVHPGTLNEQARALNQGVFRDLINTMRLAEFLGKFENGA